MSNIIDLGDVTGKEIILTIIPSSKPAAGLRDGLNPDAVDAVMEREYSHKPILNYEQLEERTGVRI